MDILVQAFGFTEPLGIRDQSSCLGGGGGRGGRVVAGDWNCFLYLPGYCGLSLSEALSIPFSSE